MKAFLATLKGKIIAGALGVLVVAGGIVAAVALSGPEDYRSIKVDAVSGQAIIVDEKNNQSEAYKGMNLKAGNSIEVKDGANMTLLMDSDKYMFADEGTKFKVEASGDSAKANTKTRIILEEGSVKVDLYKENGEKMEEEGLIEAGQAATVHSNTDISEFVIGASDISYDDFSGPMAEFVINAVDNGREICIGENQFKHYTGYETHPEEEIIVKEPTATEEGLKEIYCPTCDEVIRTEAIPATGETIEEEDETELVEDAPEVETEEEITETEPDVTQTHTHSYGSWSIVTAASCETAGVEARTCTNSGCQSTETQSIAATGHSTTYVHEITGNSYTDNTFTANYNGVCSICGEIVSSEEHSGTYTTYQSETYLNAKCSCGYEFSYSF